MPKRSDRFFRSQYLFRELVNPTEETIGQLLARKLKIALATCVRDGGSFVPEWAPYIRSRSRSVSHLPELGERARSVILIETFAYTPIRFLASALLTCLT
jgi:hypothetical protein